MVLWRSCEVAVKVVNMFLSNYLYEKKKKIHVHLWRILEIFKKTQRNNLIDLCQIAGDRKHVTKQANSYCKHL